jgi:hypothetical protein
MMLGDQYKFLGVVAGGYQEGAVFTLNVATTFKGQTESNSGISVVVPASNVRALLFNSAFTKQLDVEMQHAKQSSQ